MDYRMERDSMGEMEVPADRYWGAQTQRSYQNFQIGTEKMPEEIVRAFGILKKAAALANHRLGKLDDERLGLISRACDEVVAGKLDGHFPLVVWQTGSGTQSNMNVNEVVANRGNELAGKKLLHPNDHVNMSQSSNDTFPTAMHIAAAVALEDKLLPAIDGLVETFRRLEGENGDVVKSGRTHLQDAVPITLAQEISGWRTSLEKDRAMVELALPGLRELALGGTAVGTGLNAPKGFDTGGIYESYGRGWLIQIPDEKENILKQGEWNTMRIRVQGDNVQTWLNGEEMVNIRDEKIGAGQGRIALQIHDGGGIKVLWRNLHLQTL